MTDNEKLALQGLSGTSEQECYRSFKRIAEGGLALHLVRRTVRALARKGLAVYEKGLWTDDGTPAGAGYALTKAGEEMLDKHGLRVPEFWY